MSGTEPRCVGIGVRGAYAFAALLLVLIMARLLATPALAADRLQEFLAQVEPEDLMAGAERFGQPLGDPPAVPVYGSAGELEGEDHDEDDDEQEHDDLIGYAFLNSDLVDAVGYSGKPIHVLVGLDLDGTITGAKLVEHHEPIVLIGIPEKKITAYIDRYTGRQLSDFAGAAAGGAESVDVISGATVTVMVIEDSVTHAAAKVARRLGLGGLSATGGAEARGLATIDMSRAATRDWQSLLGDGSVRRLRLSIGDVNRAFERTGDQAAIGRPEKGAPDELFMDLFVAPVNVPVIGRSLLGDAEYDLLASRLEPGQQAVLIAANGRYSFKGSGYVRGGIFDRVHLVQGDDSIRFRDRQHKNLGVVAADGAPDFREVGLFVFPPKAQFDPTEPWRLELLVQRAIGAIKKAFISYHLGYTLPKLYVKRAAPVARSVIPDAAEDKREALWQRIWRSRPVDIAVAVIALGVLTLIFFSQNWLASHPRLTTATRVGFLLFTTLWIGAYAQAQLSVVNVFTFFNALIGEFRWDYFLLDPLMFVLWCSVAASLLFWGRGAYCGWLCPFGALQELLNRLAKLVRVPQFTVPWGVHERLWPIKYMIFMVLFGLSIYDLALAEALAEVEPFKTAVVLKFAREWPFVVYALTLLGIGLFVERFFCRYLCPLGAALAIPGRIRMFDWLKRHPECGATCHRCAQECMVQAIHPDGQINPNECLYCLHCQSLYYDGHKCPPMIQRRLKRERRLALQSKSMAGASRQKSVAATPILEEEAVG